MNLLKSVKCIGSSVFSEFARPQINSKFCSFFLKSNSIHSLTKCQNDRLGKENHKNGHFRNIDQNYISNRKISNESYSKLKKAEGIEEDVSLIATRNKPTLAYTSKFGDIFPDETTKDQVFGGVKYSNLNIIYVTVTKNNSKFVLTDTKGRSVYSKSNGCEGFKNAKKGTNVAAQATGQEFGKVCLQKGHIYCRVVIRGLGPGREAGIKGLVLGGIQVISITDLTPVAFKVYPRPRKARRV